MTTGTMVQFGEVERPLGELTLAEVETLRRTWREANRITTERRDAMLATSFNWFEALCERLPGSADTFRAMLDEATARAHHWADARWRDEAMLEARIEELSPPVLSPLFDDEL